MMKFIKSLAVAAVIILTCSFKIGYDWAQAWVDNKVISKDELPGSVLKSVNESQLTLVLLSKKDLITTLSNGNTYLRCYLMNNTDTTTSIDRADATITGFSTEILKNKAWQHFQRPIVPSCGNSYWTQKLESKKVLAIQLDHVEKGSINVPFRVAYTHHGTIIHSNAIMVEIDQKNYDRVGK